MLYFNCFCLYRCAAVINSELTYASTAIHLDLQNTRHDPYISRRVFVEIVNDFHLPFQLVLGYVQLQKQLTMYVKYELGKLVYIAA